MNSSVRVSITIDAPPAAVWESVSDLASHTAWMTDAESIAFRTDQRRGVGTVMEVFTRIGPLHTTDIMEVIEWLPGAAIGVRHEGVVSGSGRFALEAVGDGTRFTWHEQLRFPWFFGGPVGAWVSRPLFGWIWRRNLRRLKALVEQHD